MAKLVKITNVHLYVGLTDGAAECVEVLKLLRNSGIKYTLLNYSDQDQQHKANFEALSTWNFGSRETSYKKTFTDYPILVWQECYDDWSTVQHGAQGIKEISKSSLFINKELTEKA